VYEHPQLHVHCTLTCTSACACISTTTCACTSMYALACTSECTWACASERASTYISACTCTSTSACTGACACTYTRSCARACNCTRSVVHVHVHIHTFMCMYQWSWTYISHINQILVKPDFKSDYSTRTNASFERRDLNHINEHSHCDWQSVIWYDGLFKFVYQVFGRVNEFMIR